MQNEEANRENLEASMGIKRSIEGETFYSRQKYIDVVQIMCYCIFASFNRIWHFTSEKGGD